MVASHEIPEGCNVFLVVVGVIGVSSRNMTGLNPRAKKNVELE
jgi:hypothetical protein